VSFDYFTREFMGKTVIDDNFYSQLSLNLRDYIYGMCRNTWGVPNFNNVYDKIELIMKFLYQFMSENNYHGISSSIFPIEGNYNFKCMDKHHEIRGKILYDFFMSYRIYRELHELSRSKGISYEDTPEVMCKVIFSRILYVAMAETI
jgi:hypothetical protein